MEIEWYMWGLFWIMLRERSFFTDEWSAFQSVISSSWIRMDFFSVYSRYASLFPLLCDQLSPALVRHLPPSANTMLYVHVLVCFGNAITMLPQAVRSCSSFASSPVRILTRNCQQYCSYMCVCVHSKSFFSISLVLDVALNMWMYPIFEIWNIIFDSSSVLDHKISRFIYFSFSSFFVVDV